MGLMSFKDYRATHGKNESSPSTRNKWAAFLGLQPMHSADVFGHATPIAPVAEKLLAKLKDHKDKKEKGEKGHKSKKKESKKKKKKDEAAYYETDQKPDYSFDKFIDKAEKARKDVEKDQEDGQKEQERLSKEIEKLSKKTDNDPSPPDKHDVHHDQDDSDDVVASLTKQAKKEPKPEKIKTPANQKPAPKTPKTEGNKDFSAEECNEWDQIFSSSLKESDQE